MREVLATLREHAILLSLIGALLLIPTAVATGDYFSCHPISLFESQTLINSELNELTNSSTGLPDGVRSISVSGNRLDVLVHQYSPSDLEPSKPLSNFFGLWEAVYNAHHGGSQMRPLCVIMRILANGHVVDHEVSNVTVTGYLTGWQFP